MRAEESQVRKFYDVIWNQYAPGVVPEVLHENITFRGSLGITRHGHEEFIEYLDTVHRALGEYRCVINDLVCEANQVFARMTFSGIHRGELMGCKPTGKRVIWAGAALFTFEADKVMDLWVLGDLTSLKEQMTASSLGL